MTSPILKVRPLNGPEFRPFGLVVSAGGHHGLLVNQGRALRFDTGSVLDHSSTADRLVMATYRVSASHLPLALALFERHPHSDQLFVPMSAARYLVVVAPGGEEPERDGAIAFIAGQAAAVIYRAGVWHYPLVALDAMADFSMLMWETGAGTDTEIAPLAEPLTVHG